MYKYMMIHDEERWNTLMRDKLDKRDDRLERSMTDDIVIELTRPNCEIKFGGND